MGHTDSPGDHSSPWSSAGRSPCLCASVLQKADAEIRPSWAAGNCTGASEGSSACNLFGSSGHIVTISVQWEQMLSPFQDFTIYTFFSNFCMKSISYLLYNCATLGTLLSDTAINQIMPTVSTKQGSEEKNSNDKKKTTHTHMHKNKNK